jgi:pyrimidine operon attenuation protein/uracil phosphoribosyltransferase
MYYLQGSIRSALTAIQSFERPSEIELLVLIDRFQPQFTHTTGL